MYILTDDKLRQILPHSTAGNRSKFLPALGEAMRLYGINTPLRIAAFLAQIGHESGSLRYVRELASGEAYEGRKDLGNTRIGDGVRFKGRGLIQVTGRTNYTIVARALEIDCVNHPGLLEVPGHAAESAAWWWQTHGLNELADRGEFEKITRKINGGLNGQRDRQTIYARAKKVLGI